MKICIVGGTGNISSSIVDLLIKSKHEVVCFNRGLRGSLPKNVRLIKGDRSILKILKKKFKKKILMLLSICYVLIILRPRVVLRLSKE